ncbi:MAG: transcriptional regulator [Candidatus Solibacter sp.]|nr:transcriptional regulator [Candidatus Solibacter sp.]
MSDQELEALLRDLESDRAERKRSAADRDNLKKTICALANDLPAHGCPGVLFIGVEDDGACANLPIDDQLLRLLAGFRQEGQIVPLPSMRVQKRSLLGCEVAVVEVEPSSTPPVRFRGNVWVRMGPTTVLAGADDERRLSERRRSSDLPFDLRGVRGADLESLDLEWCRSTYLPTAVSAEILAENHRSIAEQLVSLRFASSVAEPVPTVLGMLIAGKDPRAWIPGAYVQFARFDGPGLTSPIVDQAEISGTMTEIVRRLEEKLNAHIRVTSDVVGRSVEARRPDFPLDALRQLVRNALIHRNYEGTNSPVRVSWFEDRIEIWSPGGPFGSVNRANFGQAGVTDYRNPGLAEAMKNLGFVQRFGMGIEMAREAMARNGNPAPEFAVEQNAVMVTLRRHE